MNKIDESSTTLSHVIENVLRLVSTDLDPEDAWFVLMFCREFITVQFSLSPEATSRAEKAVYSMLGTYHRCRNCGLLTSLRDTSGNPCCLNCKPLPQPQAAT